MLSALGAGLAGLSLGGGATADPTRTVRVTSAASVVTLSEPRVADVPRHSSRSAVRRTAPKARPVTHKRVARWYRPSSAAVTSPFGRRWGRMHEGIDFGAHYGDSIRAIGDGIVLGSGFLADEGGYGRITLIRHRNGIISAYAHQSATFVHAGQFVHGGQVIGLVGATGHVTGPHLHFEIRRALHGGQINPLVWLRQHHVRV